jgi:hypothetical protein
VLGDAAHTAVGRVAGAAVNPKRARVSKTMPVAVAAACFLARCRTRGCQVTTDLAFETTATSRRSRGNCPLT